MTWSTRELAELAGTTARTVRHYHEIGLLDEPDRRANGYKQYDVTHLARLRRIKCLGDLGFSLPEIGAMGEHDPSDEALRALDGELASAVERLQRARARLRTLRRLEDTPRGQPERTPTMHRARRGAPTVLGGSRR